ncbi:hypothetical protein BH10PLA1_BH10PLA1_07600 [soil metagenome]
MRSWLILTVVLLASPMLRADESPLIVHEWGTFTSLQNSNGDAIGGINTDDEPVPGFVHTLDSSLVSRSTASTQPQGKGAFPVLHPDITMRLETPVIYFYRPAGSAGPLTADVSVTFHGGYLSQYYPNVTGPQPVVTQDIATGTFKPVETTTAHTISWPNLQIGTGGVGPATSDRVWTAPREVNAEYVTSEKGESEKFLFYRGVGHLVSPLKVLQDGPNLRLTGEPVLQPPIYRMGLSAAWLVDIRADGMVAFQSVKTLNFPAVPDGNIYDFIPLDDYSAENLLKLRTAMRSALVADGLFADEADAMLNTWEASYFKSPGLRVFYIVPPAWTDKVLPLKVSIPAKITRVMVGRIELVTPEQQALLGTISNRNDVPRLGRFAAALLNEEERQRPSARLVNLIAEMNFSSANVARSVAGK